MTKEEYNNIPVHYCKSCLSLNIRESNSASFCKDCGNTETEQAHIEDWEYFYKREYGKEYS